MEFSGTLAKHTTHLAVIFATVERVGLLANIENCQVAWPEIRCHELVVGSGRHAPDPTTLATIQGSLVFTIKQESSVTSP